MSIVTLSKATTILPIAAMLALAGCGGGGGGTPPGMMPTDMGSPGNTPTEAIDISEFLTPAFAESGSPGMIAAIVDEDGVRAIGASGVRRRGFPEEMTANDLLHIGSNTKAMTSTMLATLVQDGTFANGWNTTVAEVFPEFASSIHLQYHTVTVEQLLRMNGGLPRNAANWSAYSENSDIVERRYNILRDNLANAPAGAVGDFLYSNLSYVLAGAMAERLTGKSWETLMQEQLFEPLGITTAGFGPPGTPGEVDQPWGHVPDGSGGWHPTQDDKDAARGPAGTVHISIEDWAKFISLWFTDKQPAILDRSTLIQLTTPVTGNYAAGWGVTRYRWAGGTTIQHSGSHNRWRSRLWIAPEHGVAYVMVANAAGLSSHPQYIQVDDALWSLFASLVTNENLPGGATRTAHDHVIQIAPDDHVLAGALRNEDGDLMGMLVGDTPVSLDFHRFGRVAGGSQRPTIGSILQNEDIRIRHIHSHWDMSTDVVSPYEYISFGAWATVAPETGGNAGFDYRYESVGDGYLAALDSARTPIANLPISGTATYLGQYTGFFKGQGVDGVILRSTGDVDITADFANSSLMVEMLSTSGRELSLSGSIQGNGFSGTTIVHMDTTLLQVAGATASMQGGFYGDGAGEAGGVFEIVGGHAQDPGRFVGAFGGKEAN